MDKLTRSCVANSPKPHINNSTFLSSPSTLKFPSMQRPSHHIILIILNVMFQVTEWKIVGVLPLRYTLWKHNAHILTLTFIHLSFENMGGWSPVSFILTQYLSLTFNRESAQQVEMEGTIAILTSHVQWIQRTSGGFSMTVGTLFSACTFANMSCCDGEHFFLCFGLLIPY